MVFSVKVIYPRTSDLAPKPTAMPLKPVLPATVPEKPTPKEEVAVPAKPLTQEPQETPQMSATPTQSAPSVPYEPSVPSAPSIPTDQVVSQRVIRTCTSITRLIITRTRIIIMRHGQSDLMNYSYRPIPIFNQGSTTTKSLFLRRWERKQY